MSGRHRRSWRDAWGRVRPLLASDVGGDQRGVALLVVLVSAALFSAFTTEFAYNTRVTVQIAGNLQRDVQAYYHARSSIEISRMVIRSQNLVQQLLGGAGGNIELWKYACKFAEIYNSGKIEFFGLEIADLSDQDGIGVTKGGFECEVFAEDGKVNVNDVDDVAGKQRIFSSLFQYLRGRDADPNRFTNADRRRAEVLLNMMDWADDDRNATDIDPNWNIIDQGNSSEDGAYAKYDYKPKNAKFDSIEEVRLVAGMDDETFCRLREQITVYSTERLNVNAADSDLLKAIICQSFTDPTQQMMICGAGAGAIGMAPIDIVGQVLEQCRQIKGLFFAPLFRNFNDFTSFFQRVPALLAAGTGMGMGMGMGMGGMMAGGMPPIAPNPNLRNVIGFRGRVIRVNATGQLGTTVKRLSSVIDTRTGKYVYWGER